MMPQARGVRQIQAGLAGTITASKKKPLLRPGATAPVPVAQRPCGLRWRLFCKPLAHRGNTMPSTRTAPSTPSAASPLTLPAGTCTWMRLPPGAVLRVAEGRIALQAGPAMCGQVLLAQPPVQRLATGHGWSAPQPGEAAWLQLSSMGKDAAARRSGLAAVRPGGAAAAPAGRHAACHGREGCGLSSSAAAQGEALRPGLRAAAARNRAARPRRFPPRAGTRPAGRR